MDTRTRFVFLMHPKEFKREKAGTGRLTHLCLTQSELHMGIAFDEHETVQALIHNCQNFVVLLYPGPGARNLSKGDLRAEELEGKRLVVIVLDGTWSCARKMLKLSPSLQRLPRIMFTPTALSRYTIKQQPQEGCLSTLEATHELLVVLEHSGLDHYARPEQLLALFDRMQTFQIRCAADSSRAGYRRRPYSEITERKVMLESNSARRSRFLKS